MNHPPAADSRMARLERRSRRLLRRALAVDTEHELRLVRPPSGRGGRTFMVQAEGRTLAVLRVFALRNRLVRLRESTRKLQFLGVPVPRLLLCNTSHMGRLWRGAYVAVEEFLEGVPLGKAHDRTPALDQLAGSLARLHSEHRDSWGTFGRRKRTGYAGSRLRMARQIVRRLSLVEGLTREEARDLLVALAAWKPRLEALRDFQLLHNDLHFNNVLVHEDGHVSLLDLYRMRYDRRERELSAVAVRLLDLDPCRVSRFLEMYEQQGGKSPEPGLWEFETLLVCLDRWARMLEQARSGDKSQAAWAADQIKIWEKRVRVRVENVRVAGRS